MSVSFPSSSGRSPRITIAQYNIRPSEHSAYELSVTTKRCVLKGLKVNIGDWLVSQPLCYSNVLMYASLKLCALREVKEKENIGNYDG